MLYLLLASSIVGITVQEVTNKEYNKRVSGGTFTFAAFSTLFALVVFLLSSGGKLEFSLSYVLYSICFAVFYSVTIVCTFLAIANGPLSITGLISKYSLLIPTLYGIIFLDEPQSYMFYIGLCLLVISLLLINYEGKKNEKKLSLKWGIFIIIAFITNGGCSVLQKVQQLRFNGEGKSEFMIVALIVSFLIMFIVALIFERKDLGKNIKSRPYCFIVCGFANGIVNLFVMLLAAWPASVVFPVISAGGVILTALIGIVVYKEKLSVLQIIGLVLGIACVVIFNI